MQPPETSWMNIPRTEELLRDVYLFRGVEDEDVYKDGTARALIGNYGATWLQLASARARVGDTVEVTIVSVDEQQRRIALSMVEQARRSRDAEDSAARHTEQAALDQINEKRSLGTFGDLLAASKRKPR